MIILGLDPGLARTGFGVVNVQTSALVAGGCLVTPAGLAVADRLHTLGTDLEELLTRWRPERAVLETVLFGTNAKTAMLTAEVRGVLSYVLRAHRVPVHNLTPLQIKSRLTGYGSADKHQIQQVVRQRLGLREIPKPDDAADALAAALCWTAEPILAAQRTAAAVG